MFLIIFQHISLQLNLSFIFAMYSNENFTQESEKKELRINIKLVFF